jgi:peptide/nickel transport system ATP-binding protein
VMYAGEFVETGTAREIFAAPAHPYTQGLLRCIPVPGGTRHGARPEARLGSIPGLVPAMIGKNHGCMFRNRCNYAEAACAAETPPFRDLAPGRGYRCTLAPDACAENFRAAGIGAAAQ